MAEQFGWVRIVLLSGLVGGCSQSATAAGPMLSGNEAGETATANPGGQAGAQSSGRGNVGGSAGSEALPVGAGAGTAGDSDMESLPSESESAVTTVTWKVLAESMDSNVYATTPAAASRGEDAAVAYVEVTDAMPATTRVVMQRFDAQGERVGPLLVLGNDADRSADVTLASDGKQYAACWNASSEIHCALVSSAGTAQPSPLTLAGQYPTLVAGPDGWVIAYAVQDTTLRLQPLTPDFKPNGTAVDLKRSASFSYPRAGALFTRTPSGFALVGASMGDEHDQLLRLNADLQPVGAPIPLGRDFWFYGQLIASDQRAAVSFSAPYGSYLLLLNTEQVTAELPIAGGGKTGMDEAVALTGNGIGSAWLAGDNSVRTRFFRDGHDADVGLTSPGGPAPLLGMPEEGTESYQQLLKVEDQTLLVARGYRYGYLGPAAIRVSALRFP